MRSTNRAYSRTRSGSRSTSKKQLIEFLLGPAARNNGPTNLCIPGPFKKISDPFQIRAGLARGRPKLQLVSPQAAAESAGEFRQARMIRIIVGLLDLHDYLAHGFLIGLRLIKDRRLSRPFGAPAKQYP
jgi:hypothetical protein